MIAFDHPGPHKRLKRAIVWLRDVGWLLFTRARVSVVRWDGPEWSVLFVHDGCTHAKEELLHLLFPEPPTESDAGWRFLWRIPAVIQKATAEGCLVVCDLNRLLRWGAGARYNFRIPCWLRASLDVSGSEEKVLGAITKNRRRWIRKLPESGFSYEFSRRPEDFELFYHRMYLPYVTQRHQDRAIIEPIETKRAAFDKGGLVWVEYRGQSVAAGLRHAVGDTLIAGSYAIHEDHTGLIKQGVAVALHWFTVDWARRNQLRAVDLGMTRARLNDGVFEYKRQWGARFEGDVLTHTVWTFVGEDLPAKLIRHLNDLGLIAQVGPEYRCVVFADGHKADVSGVELARKKDASARASLNGLLILPGMG